MGVKSAAVVASCLVAAACSSGSTKNSPAVAGTAPFGGAPVRVATGTVGGKPWTANLARGKNETYCFEVSVMTSPSAGDPTTGCASPDSSGLSIGFAAGQPASIVYGLVRPGRATAVKGRLGTQTFEANVIRLSPPGPWDVYLSVTDGAQSFGSPNSVVATDASGAVVLRRG